MASHYTRRCWRIVEEYREAGGPWPARKTEMAEWAIGHELWDIPREGKLRVLADDLAKAMRQEYITDADGHRVRVKHPVEMVRYGEQGMFWGDLRTENRDFMARSTAQRRNGIVADCRQLKNDVDYFNTLHPEYDPLQLRLDFTRDVAELETTGPRQNRSRPSTEASSSSGRWRRSPLSLVADPK